MYMWHGFLGNAQFNYQNCIRILSGLDIKRELNTGFSENAINELVFFSGIKLY